MAVPFKPHTITVQPAETGDAGDNVAGGTDYGDPVTLKVHVQPVTVSEGYGVKGPDLSHSYIIFAEVADLEHFGRGALIAWGTRTLKVTARPSVFSDGLPLDHIEVEADEQQYAEN